MRAKSDKAHLSGILKDSKRGNRASSGGGVTVATPPPTAAQAAQQQIQLTGPVTGVSSTTGILPTSITANAITDAHLADMPAATVKMRAVGAGTGDPINGTVAQLIALIATGDGAGSGLDADLLDGLNSSDFQPVDADLTAIAALSGTGMLSRTGTNTWATRTLQAPSAGFTITNPAGIAGDPTFVLANDLSALEAQSGTGMMARTAADTYAHRTLTGPAAGITVSNGSGVAGNPTLALANDLSALEGLASTGFAARTGTDAWAQRTLTAPAAGFTITNPAGIAGNPTFALSDDLSAVEGLGSTGIAVRTAANTWAQRSIVAGNQISVTNGDGVSGNITIAVTEGAGSGLDADTLDGFDSTAFPRKAEAATISSAWNFSSGLTVGPSSQHFSSQAQAQVSSSTDGGFVIDSGASGVGRLFFTEDGTDANTGLIRYAHSTDTFEFYAPAGGGVVNAYINANGLLAPSFGILTAHTPSSAAAAGFQGRIAWDSSFLYVCTATNTWKRVAIATW